MLLSELPARSDPTAAEPQALPAPLPGWPFYRTPGPGDVPALGDDRFQDRFKFSVPTVMPKNPAATGVRV